MKEFEKLIENLDKLITDTYYKSVDGSASAGIENGAYRNVKKIVNQLAEEHQAGLKDYVEGQEIEPYGRPRVYMTIEDLNELKAYRDFGTLPQMRFLNEWYHEQLEEEHNGGWIPCSERLPKSGVEDWVLVQIEETDSGFRWIPRIAELRRDMWYLIDTEYPLENTFKVVAWQPLPAPYKEGVTENGR